MSKIFIVGTPIGNLGDITYRAINTLKEVDIIACEDKRNSIKLLNYYEITSSKLISYHSFNEKNSSKGIINLVKQGKSIAVISDAGMPSISDPGFTIINDAKKENIEVTIIPGVSSVISAFVWSSLDNTFFFKGFLKHNKESIMQELSKLETGTYIYFVSTHKLLVSLETIDYVFKGEEKVFLAKEMTKMNESFFEGNAKEILSLINNENQKGEFCLVLNIPKKKRIKINKYSKNNKDI
ncbi:MAG: 16S rRNA (cytidine(1402)-2'-O)-methyltransferase [Metamycoplasmataceae bacterium]